MQNRKHVYMEIYGLDTVFRFLLKCIRFWQVKW